MTPEEREANRATLCAALDEHYGTPKCGYLTREEIMFTNDRLGLPFPHFLINSENKAGRCMYFYPAKNDPAVAKTSKVAKFKAPKVSVDSKVAESLTAEMHLVVSSVDAPSVGEFTKKAVSTDVDLIPRKDPVFVPYGVAVPLKNILRSGMFFPTLISGLSGNGKTYTPRQICAILKRPVLRVNLTDETDEDDLIGGFRLIEGETKFFKGPVIRAMEMGAVLLLDEIDLANPARIMCLQSILEGSDYLIKKTGERVTPQPGFTVVATANTKGQGSDDGRFIGTNVLNEAFLERFPVTFEQDYPPQAIECRILNKMNSVELGIDADVAAEFITNIVAWANVTRNAFKHGACSELISTRRLTHILKSFAIFGDKLQAIQFCVNRFDDETKASFLDLYAKIDSGVDMAALDAMLGADAPATDEGEW